MPRIPDRLRRGGSEARICEASGLQLRPATGQRIWRIAKTSYGALNPPLRPMAESRLEWGRYDVPDHRTAYGAWPKEASYAESLASQRVASALKKTKVGAIFEDEARAARRFSLLDAVEAEWSERSHMAPSRVAAGWRLERLLYEIALPAAGWFVEIEASRSVSAVSKALHDQLEGLNVQALTVADLRGENRSVTTTVSEWVHGVTLDDGSRPHGIVYGSKHGSDWNCWAVWLRATDDGNPSGELTTADDGCEILPPSSNPSLQEVAHLFDLRVF